MINESLYFNAYENQEKNKIIYRDGDNLEGLENVLYQCPKCGRKAGEGLPVEKLKELGGK